MAAAGTETAGLLHVGDDFVDRVTGDDLVAPLSQQLAQQCIGNGVGKIPIYRNLRFCEGEECQTQLSLARICIKTFQELSCACFQRRIREIELLGRSCIDRDGRCIFFA